MMRIFQIELACFFIRIISSEMKFYFTKTTQQSESFIRAIRLKCSTLGNKIISMPIFNGTIILCDLSMH